MRDSAVATATAWEIFNVAPTIVVGQMKLTVAPTLLMLEVKRIIGHFTCSYFGHCHSQITVKIKIT